MSNSEITTHDPTSISRKSKKKKWSKPKKIWVSVLVVFLLFLGGAGTYAGFLYSKFDQTLNKISGSNGKTANAASIPVATEPITILLMGIDARGDGETLNSDVIMPFTLNPITKSATLVSVPRDMEITFDGHSRKSNYVFPHYYIVDKEHAFPKTKEFWSNKLGIPIDYTVTVDFQGFREAIDVLGGIDVNVKMDMCYQDSTDGTNINLKAGQQHLDGAATLDYVRYRKSNCGTKESTDYDRNLRQQEVLDQLFSKLKSFDMVTKVTDILNVVGDNLETDISPDNLKQLILSYMNIDRGKINFIGLNGEWVSPFMVIPDEEWENAKRALKIERMRTAANPNPTIDPKTRLGTDMKSNYRSSGNNASSDSNSSKSQSSNKNTDASSKSKEKSSTGSGSKATPTPRSTNNLKSTSKSNSNQGSSGVEADDRVPKVD
ncbi:LCP family protein [Paenibacillus larvae]